MHHAYEKRVACVGLENDAPIPGQQPHVRRGELQGLPVQLHFSASGFAPKPASALYAGAGDYLAGGELEITGLADGGRIFFLQGHECGLFADGAKNTPDNAKPNRICLW
jgi:hypothetical protein